MNEKIKEVLSDKFTADIEKISKQIVDFLENGYCEDHFTLSFREAEEIQILLDVYLAMTLAEAKAKGETLWIQTRSITG